MKPEYKVKEFSRAMPGISCLGYGLSALWSLVCDEGDQYIEHIIKTMSINTAKVAKIDCNLVVGGFATFVLWNPNEDRKSVVYPDSPYCGLKLKGEVKYVFVKGKVVYMVDNL